MWASKLGWIIILGATLSDEPWLGIKLTKNSLFHTFEMTKTMADNFVHSPTRTTYSYIIWCKVPCRYIFIMILRCDGKLDNSIRTTLPWSPCMDIISIFHKFINIILKKGKTCQVQQRFTQNKARRKWLRLKQYLSESRDSFRCNTVYLI